MTFAVGDYIDKVDCDVVPMDACHLLLGRPWQFDHDAVHAGRSNTYTFMHDGSKYVLKPMPNSAITRERPVSERTVVQKLDSKPRTVSLQGREDDTAMVTSNFEVTRAKAVKEVNANLISKSDYFVAKRVTGAMQKKANISNIIAEKTSVHLPNLRRCRDGKMRMVCGPGLASMADQRDDLKHNHIHPSVMRVYALCDHRARGELHKISPEIFATYQGDNRTIWQNPAPIKVVPTFRTPPEYIRIGSFHLKLHAYKRGSAKG